LQLYHCEDSTPRLNDSLALLYGYLPRLLAEYTPVECDPRPVFNHRSAWKGIS
jgi:hypothetical protein